MQSTPHTGAQSCVEMHRRLHERVRGTLHNRAPRARACKIQVAQGVRTGSALAPCVGPLDQIDSRAKDVNSVGHQGGSGRTERVASENGLTLSQQGQEFNLSELQLGGFQADNATYVGASP